MKLCDICEKKFGWHQPADVEEALQNYDWMKMLGIEHICRGCYTNAVEEIRTLLKEMKKREIA